MNYHQINPLAGLTAFPSPKILNFQINEICNARRFPLSIWGTIRKRELILAEFSDWLQSPLFQSVEYVGITGGEPILRPELGKFYAMLPAALPALKGASFITNGFKNDRTVDVYGGTAEEYRSRGLHFSGLISIDDAGSVHHRVRGRAKAWEHATDTLFKLRAANVDVHACCTIVKSNLWSVHALLDWAKANGIHMRFCVAEFINRRYNLDLGTQIRAFQPAEIRHLVSFLHKLLLDEYETDSRIQLTYESILSILTGGERLVGYPYQTSAALNLDSQGRFTVCAPKGTPAKLGFLTPLSFWGRRDERTRILRQACPNCIHDYHAEWTPTEAGRRAQRKLTANALATLPPADNSPAPAATRHTRLLITGWYGSETAGDIAILGGILIKYKSNGYQHFTVTSLYPAYSKITLTSLAEELGVQLDIVPLDDPALFESLCGADEIIMGGGPLMDIEPTEQVRALFRRARQLGRPCHVEGCGVGPLNNPRFQKVVAEILGLSTHVRLRDSASARAASALVPEVEVEVIPDPSEIYLSQTGIRWQPNRPDRVIRAFFRMLTHEYPQSMDMTSANAAVVDLLKLALETWPDHRIELCAMHWFTVGWDDREFAMDLAARVGSSRLTVDLVPRTPREILQLMAEADTILCMRFHSLVFAHNIGAPYLALDYTAGGKIAAFLEHHGRKGTALRYEDIHRLDTNSLRAAVQPPAPPHPV